MSLPTTANTTGDIYRSGVGPPAAPSVAGVACHLDANFARGLEVGESTAVANRFTHVILVDATVDVRDDYNLGAVGVNLDSVYIPDKNGTAFKVIFVERKLKGTAQDHKKVYLLRQTVTWPSNNL